jgi:hypothetical protein
METFQQWLPKLVQVMTESRVLGAVIIMVAALIAAKVIDVFIDRSDLQIPGQGRHYHPVPAEGRSRLSPFRRAFGRRLIERLIWRIRSTIPLTGSSVFYIEKLCSP